MVRKFECWDCHKVFQADDKKDVVCPFCKSDNVDFASRHISFTKITLSVIAIVVIGFGIDYMIKNGHDSKDDVNGSNIDTETNYTDSADIESEKVINSTYEEETGLKIPPFISLIGEKKLNDDQTYSFKVEVKNAPNNSYIFTLTDKTTGKIIAKSSDGSFNGVPPSKADGGVYLIQIIDKKTDSLLCTPQSMDGFLPVKKVDHKLSVSDLQRLLDSEDETLIGNGENPYLSPGYTIKYIGLSNDDPHPTNLADVIEKIYMDVWRSVKVESLEYDNSSHISNITLKITK